MTTDDYIKFIQSPELFQDESINQLKTIIDKYPYFQSARSLYLKALKNKESYKYNNELKVTATHTTDRSVLFDFITSKSFTSTKKDSEKRSLKEIVIQKTKLLKTDTTNEELAIGKPLNFTKKETFSFNQWLELSSKNSIVRDQSSEKKIEKNSEKDILINRFIETSPKITRPTKGISKEIKVTESQQNNRLMTETLAKVYLEQKKYDSAIQAYKILSLKYPEKSGFFADQIKKIKILQNNK
ncbi:hypothetical protein SAMN04487765_1969 [Tenacibaculum sp. MAR_2010_89]|uniref:hypothetical protein n=2 Tax=unclassified Tenacibaculum TaxID=2635139 RepID=UPI00089A00F6|nr:hypothetical protein [Tenacibaculum sp. MAR_2010_89]SEE27267.1 hypothetical protein SAMN04487765_1969 [Tenacibaculum sp. MAR_2010_89]